MCWRRLSWRLKSFPQFLYGHLCAARECQPQEVDETRGRRTLLVSVDAANVAFEVLAALEALIAPGHLAFVATNVL